MMGIPDELAERLVEEDRRQEALLRSPSPLLGRKTPQPSPEEASKAFQVLDTAAKAQRETQKQGSSRQARRSSGERVGIAGRQGKEGRKQALAKVNAAGSSGGYGDGIPAAPTAAEARLLADQVLAGGGKAPVAVAEAPKEKEVLTREERLANERKLMTGLGNRMEEHVLPYMDV